MPKTLTVQALRGLGWGQPQSNLPFTAVSERSALKAGLAERTYAKAAFLQGISTCPPRNLHFSGLFCGFSLRSLPALAIVPCGPGFSESNGGSQLAACFDRIGVKRKNQEDKHTRWQPSH